MGQVALCACYMLCVILGPAAREGGSCRARRLLLQGAQPHSGLQLLQHDLPPEAYEMYKEFFPLEIFLEQDVPLTSPQWQDF